MFHHKLHTLVDGFIFPMAEVPPLPLHSSWPVKDSNKLAAIVDPKVLSMRGRLDEPKVWWQTKGSRAKTPDVIELTFCVGWHGIKHKNILLLMFFIIVVVC